jgi:hypothetical protein
MKQLPKQRFSKGRRVLVGMMQRPGTVMSVDDVPSIMGEYVHVVLVDGEQVAQPVVSCDIHPTPVLDADLRGAEAHSATRQSGGGERVATIEEVIIGIDQLLKELRDIRQSSPSDRGLRDANLKTWTMRACEQLERWGFLTEAEEGFSANSMTHLYSDFDTRSKMTGDRLKALRDDIATHPKHYVSKLTPTPESSPTVRPVGIPAPAGYGLSVLISHSSKDKALAEALIDLLRSGLGLLPTQIRCSSVDGYRLPAGVNSHDQLRAEIKTVGVLIGLLTPNSLVSTYVMFELGARWGADLFMIPLLAGIKPEEMRGPHGVLNALSCEADGQLVQLVEDTGKELGIPPQSAAAYLSQVRKVKSLAESSAALPSTPGPDLEQGSPAPAIAQESFKISVRAEGVPPSQVLRVKATHPIEIFRLEYQLSDGTCVGSEDVALEGESFDMPLTQELLTKLLSIPRHDMNHLDLSGPVKLEITASIGGQLQQYSFPARLENPKIGNAHYRQIIGSKVFYGKY